MFDVADVVDLAAQVEVEQVQAIAHAGPAKIFQSFDHLGDKQAELAAYATGLLPASRALGGQLHAHADARFDVVQLGVFDDQLQLAEFLYDGDDVLTDFGRQD